MLPFRSVEMEGLCRKKKGYKKCNKIDDPLNIYIQRKKRKIVNENERVKQKKSELLENIHKKMFRLLDQQSFQYAANHKLIKASTSSSDKMFSVLFAFFLFCCKNKTAKKNAKNNPNKIEYVRN